MPKRRDERIRCRCGKVDYTKLCTCVLCKARGESPPIALHFKPAYVAAMIAGCDCMKESS